MEEKKIHLRNIVAKYHTIRRFKSIFASIWGRAKLNYLINTRDSLRIVIGSSGYYDQGWIPTDIDYLDITNIEHWMRYFDENSIDAILAEHVWEHLTHSEGKIAAGYCYRFLKKDGYLRIAVPDGNHPSHEYIEMVRVGGKGCGSDDHKILYDQNSLSELLTSCGFLVNLIEYFDSEGDFHSKEWDPAKGMIHRSANNDSRNTNGQLVYTSLIIDAVKR